VKVLKGSTPKSPNQYNEVAQAAAMRLRKASCQQHAFSWESWRNRLQPGKVLLDEVERDRTINHFT